MHNKQKRVLVTGGAGYVGSVLVPNLLNKGYRVTVLDTFWFWKSPEEFRSICSANADLVLVQGDLRNQQEIIKSLHDVESVIHLACISNDPSSELDSAFTHAVNYDGSLNVINCAKATGVRRFIYASSSSVYGIKQQPNVTEDLPLEPLTQYSMLKMEVEHYLLHCLDNEFQGVIIRPSTVCGYSSRQRLDLVVNILTNFAFNKGKIKVIGGDQLRPNIHIKDMVRLYELLLEVPAEKINKKIYNAGYENLTVMQIAQLVQKVVGAVSIEVEPTDDHRSYHVCSDKIKKELGFDVQYDVKEAILELKKAFEEGRLSNLEDERYYNVKRMKALLENGKVY